MPPSPPYRPDDAQITAAALEYLHDAPDGIRLRQAVASLPHPANPSVAEIAALRKLYPPEPTHAALILARLQSKALLKFPSLPYVWATPEALEQATHAHVARHKAARFALLNPPRIFDLCAGIGGDSLAFAEVAPVTAIELSPIRSLCLRFNARHYPPPPPPHSPITNYQLPITSPPPHPLDIQTRAIQDLIPHLPPDACIHIDPARRSAGKRSPRYADLIPGPDTLQPLFTHTRAVMVKLSPAVDFDSLPPAHLEIISHNRTVVQALLLVGFGLPLAQRTATLLTADHLAWSLTAPPRPVTMPELPPDFPTPAPDKPVHLYEVDGAVTRAGLAQHLADAHHLRPLTIDGGYLLSSPGTDLLTLPPLTPFRVYAIVPLSRVAASLRNLPHLAPPGPVEVKARGRLPGTDTDQLQLAWSKICPFAFTVLLFRPHHQTLAAIALRPPTAASAPHA